METCKRCKKEFDPSMDFIEDVEMLEALNFFCNIHDKCSDCLYKLDEKLTETSREWFTPDD